jgi:phage-related minor tail protein
VADLELALVIKTIHEQTKQALKEVQGELKNVGDSGAKGGGAAAAGIESIGVHSTGVRRELLVLAHEMSQGNYSRFGGSLLVIGERMDALHYLTSGAGLAISAAGVAAVATAAAFFKGAQESEHFNKAIQLTGDYAGITEGQYRAMAQDIAEATRAHIGPSHDVLQALVASGEFTSASLQDVAKAVLDVARASGEDAVKVAGDFETMAKGVAKWAEEHNRQYHFITAAQLEYVRALEDSGRVQEAMAATSSLLTGSIATQSASVGILGRIWGFLGYEITSALDAMKNLGRDTTLEDRIQAAKDALVIMNVQELPQSELDAQQQKIDDLIAQRRDKEKAAQKKSADDQRQALVIQFNDELRAHMDHHQKILKEMEDYRKKFQALVGAPGGITQEQFDQGLAQLQPKDKGIGEAIRAAQEQFAIAKAQAENEAALMKAMDDQEKVQLEQKLKHHQISYEQYYARLGELARSEFEAQRKMAQIELQAVNKEIDELQKHSGEKEQSEVRLNHALAEREKIQGRILVLEQQEKNAVADAAIKAEGAQFKDLARDAGDALNELRAKWQLLSSEVQIGSRSQASAQAEMNQAIDAAGPHIRELIQLMQTLAETMGPEEKAKVAEYWRSFNENIKATETPMKRLVDDWKDANRQMENAAVGWMNSTADALTNFVMKGKLDFKSLADSIITDIIRIQMRKFMAGVIVEFLGDGHADGGLISGHADGGFVSGPGGPTDDRVPALLSNGEFVIQAAAVRKFGTGFFDALNDGYLPSVRRFGEGGLVTGTTERSNPDPGASVEVNIINQATGVEASSERTRGPDSREIINVVVREVARDIHDGGPVASAISQTFGARRVGRSI